MRKSILRFGALALMSLMSISSWAQKIAYSDEGSMYQLDETNKKATLYKANSGDNWNVNWGTFKYQDTDYEVIAVLDQAFKGSNVSSVRIPYTILNGGTIGKEAFYGMTITLPDGTLPLFDFKSVTLGEGAFQNAVFPENTEIDLGEQTELAKNVFNVLSSTNNITTVKCSKLQTVGEGAFQNCTSLKHFGILDYNAGQYFLPMSLTTIKNNAFQGCTRLEHFLFRSNEIDQNAHLSFVGEFAFQSCGTWFTTDVFKNICNKLEDLTYSKGSFSGCGIAGKLSLTKATKTTVSKKGTDGKTIYSGVGIPEQAFKGNAITEVILPTGCVAVQANAFEGNPIENVPLPADIQYVDEKAFEYGTNTQNTPQASLYLPLSLKSIGEGAFNNRKITTIYASAGANKDNVPELKAQTDLTVSNTVIPSVVWKDGNLKNSFESNGWKGLDFDYNVRYAKVKDAPATVTYDFVVYSITAGDDGVYTAKPTTYKTDKPTIYGQFDKAAANVKSEGDDIYPLTFKVANPESQVGTAFTGTTNYTLTFSPKKGKQGANDVNLDAASYTTISSNYVGTFASQIKNVYINDGITNVEANAFSGTSIKDVELPKSIGVAGLGTSSFAASTLKTVTVSFDKDKIPAANGAFSDSKKQLVVKEGTKATREDYLAKGDDWETFFNTDFTVKVTKVGNDAPTTTIATIDEVKGDNVTRVYELHDANDVKELSITSTSPTETPAVRYYRTFTTTNFQCWYVPFEFEYTSNDKYTFYYINNSTTKNDFTAEAAPFIELKEVKSGTKIKANTPYVIKPKVVSEEPIQFYAAKIENTAVKNFTVTSALNTFKFTGTYVQKLSNGTDNWYGVTGGNFTKFTKDKGIQAYRFYMEMAENEAGPYAPEVKFVVLDEDATSIEDVKSGSLSAPMFDLMGRQITSPAKGQVYIQNGVKKLAK